MLVSCSLVSVLVLAPPEVQVVPAAPTVELLRVPDAGIQPQVVVSADGTVHLLYFQGDADAGDLFYVARAKTERDFTAPTRVNSQSGSACAIGNDRGGKLAVGRGGAVHVVWNGSERTHAKGEEERAPFLYARRSAGATTFDAQRNLMTRSSTLDGGGDVIADEKGRVLAIWHALPVDVKEHSETSRRVFVATSTDDGTTFAGENAVSAANSGTCGCCALEAGLLRGGEIAILFRAATDSTDRGTHLLRSKDGGATFVETTLDHWKIEMCPMTTAAIASSSDANAIAWQDREEIKWARPSESAATESVALGIRRQIQPPTSVRAMA